MSLIGLTCPGCGAEADQVCLVVEDRIQAIHIERIAAAALEGTSARNKRHRPPIH
jgi:hypothetical protein